MPLFKGRVTDACGARWFPEFERRLALFGITVRWTQLIGNYGPSGGTHGGGLCGDLIVVNTGGRSLKDAYFIIVREARFMGASAAWHRLKNWDRRGGIEHCHLIGNGCSHVSGAARSQLTAVFNKRNGLANNGADPGSPKPPPRRTWSQGITWAKTQLEDDMPTPKDLWNADLIKLEEPVKTAAEIAKNPTWTPSSALTVLLREQAKQTAAIAALAKAVEKLAGKA